MITANEFYRCSLAQFEMIPEKGIFSQFEKLKLPLPIRIFEDKLPLKAYVNHGRWVIKCECGGAEMTWEEEKFMCRSCWNSGHKHQYRKAIFPKNRVKIEELLIKRPLINRNWVPGESMAQLRKENKEHAKELL